MIEQDYNPYASPEATPAINAEWQAKRRVAQALRELNELLATTTPSPEDLHLVAASLEDIAKTLGTQPGYFGCHDLVRQGGHGSVDEIMHATSPLGGPGNALAPPINIWFSNQKAYGIMQMGWAYEGSSCKVHGGFVAVVFDQFMGAAQLLGEQPGMTGTLTVRYHRPTPLNTELKLEGRLVRTEGRKTVIHAEMHAGDRVTASCEGLFTRPAGGKPSKER